MGNSGPSPFLDPGPTSTENTLGIIHLKRDLLVPTVLKSPSASDLDYAEGKVSNTRFGSFPHTTLLYVPWGSQVRASKVDTGSRGNKDKSSRKRKRDGPVDGSEEFRDEKHKTAVVADTGFAHLLPPTPETWTVSLPHRTQVVYTPDYSYVLQRLRVRPGDTIIEAGAGSGSFSHAAARAVFSGYPGDENVSGALRMGRRRGPGKVYSFEYHEPRAAKLREEIKEHGLDSIVHITHRDVYRDGFCLDFETPGSTYLEQGPQANAIFLDLPAPWMALKHLSRNGSRVSPLSSTNSPPGLDQHPQTLSPSNEQMSSFKSPLNPRTTASICTFSPCIEQVVKTVSALREHGWIDIDMVELSQKRLDVRRERVGINEDGLRGANPSPANVDEAIGRSRELEERHKAHRHVSKEKRGENNSNQNGSRKEVDPPAPPVERKFFKEGRLVHRTESELKTHTSYLVFAVLPREWTKEDEMKAKQRMMIQNSSKQQR